MPGRVYPLREILPGLVRDYASGLSAGDFQGLLAVNRRVLACDRSASAQLAHVGLRSSRRMSIRWAGLARQGRPARSGRRGPASRNRPQGRGRAGCRARSSMPLSKISGSLVAARMAGSTSIGGGGGVELAACVVGDPDRVDAGLFKRCRILGAQHAFDDQRAVPCVAQPFEIVPVGRRCAADSPHGRWRAGLWYRAA